MRSLTCVLAFVSAVVGFSLSAQAAPATSSLSDPARFASVAISTCRAGAPAFLEDAPVWSVARFVCVYGSINKEMAALFNQIDFNAVDAIVVSSEGGSVASALDMVEHMGVDQHTLVVDGFCGSSCANYLFLAARWKIVPHDAAVGWHGAPPRPEGWTAPAGMTPSAAKFMGDTIERSDRFFRNLGISDLVARETPDMQVINGVKRDVFWQHSRRDLETRYGVHGILLMR